MNESVPASVSVVVAGCGAITKFFYASALSWIESRGFVRIVALCDPNDSNRHAIQKSFPKAQGFTRLEDAPIGEGTLVVVASPPKLHGSQSIFALEHGAAVLCEKPMAASLAEAEVMVATALRVGRPLAIGLYRRFFPAARAIKDLVDRQSLGRVVSFEVEEGGAFRWEAASDSFFRRETTPGGVLYDTGVHTLDLLLWWFGEPEGFEYRDDAAGGLESNCALRLHYAKGVTGNVRLSRDWATRNLFRVNFESGSIAWHVGQAGKLALHINGIEKVLSGDLLPMCDDGLNLHLPGEGEGSPQAFVRQILDIVKAMRTGSELQIPAAEGLRSLRLIEACYAQRQVLPEPWLSDAESAGLMRLARERNV